MRVFDVEVTSALLAEIAAHGERDFPVEACGVVLGTDDPRALTRVVPLKNVQDKYHARDPIAFPRDGRDAFRIDELEHARIIDAAERDGLRELAIYHSHCDAGAYFSPEDRAAAVHGEFELIPGAIHIVVSVRKGKRADMAAFRYDAAARQFIEHRLPIFDAARILPELEVRAMEGRAAARPIRPVGGALFPRRMSEAESTKLSEESEERTIVRVDAKRAIEDLELFAGGFYSPVTGFARGVEIRSIEQSGRLLSGTPWRSALALEIPFPKNSPLPAAGSIVELRTQDDRPLAILGLDEAERISKDKVRFAGPVYVFHAIGAPSAADARAEFLRKGATRVLAVPPTFADRAGTLENAGFDAVVSLPVAESLVRDPWLAAVVAQNQGATHIWIEDTAATRAIQETLAIVPWHPA